MCDLIEGRYAYQKYQKNRKIFAFDFTTGMYYPSPGVKPILPIWIFFFQIATNAKKHPEIDFCNIAKGI